MCSSHEPCSSQPMREIVLHSKVARQKNENVVNTCQALYGSLGSRFLVSTPHYS